MHRDVCGIQSNGNIHATLEIVYGFIGKARNQIHIHVKFILHEHICVVSVRAFVLTSYNFEGFVVESLRIDGNARYAVLLHNFDNFGVYRIGTTCLDGEFYSSEMAVFEHFVEKFCAD